MKRSGYFLVFIFLSFHLVSFAQTHWTKFQGNPVFLPGTSGSWDDAWVEWPFVIKSEAEFIMYYTGFPAIDPFGAQIGRAASSDGIHWIRNENNPVLTTGPEEQWDDGSVFSGPVVLDETGYKMWYTGFDGTNYRVGLATSADGIEWTKYEGNPVLDLGESGQWDDGHLGLGTVLFDQSVYKMWYAGWENSTGIWRIGYATSDDGMTWERYEGNPVLDTGDPGDWDDSDLVNSCVLYTGTGYEMWYHASDKSLYRTGFAMSQDGITWTKYPDNPVLSPGSTWESTSTGIASVILEESKYMAWYMARRGYVSSGIGYATSPVIIHVPGQAESIQAAIDSAADGNVVLVDEGTYYENINFRGKKITVASRFYVDGDTSHISKTIIDGSSPAYQDSGSVVCFMSGEDTNSVLCGCTITGGSGTAVFDFGATILYGGGINIYNSGGKIEHNIITGNLLNGTHYYQCGGGISACGGAGYPIIIRNNRIGSNSVEAQEAWGGGVFLSTIDTLLFEKNTVINNTGQGSIHAIGGGILVDGNYGYDGITILNGNRIAFNQLHSSQLLSTKGGGIDVNYSNCELINNIIHENSAEDYGGGLHLNHKEDVGRRSQVSLINNTIVSNEAQYGGGISITGEYIDPVIINSILWNNTASVEGQEIYSDAENLIITYSDVQGGWTGEGNIDADPKLILDNPDYPHYFPHWSSPCIDAGIDSIEIGDRTYYAPDHCYCGTWRPFQSGFDMGAIEWDGNTIDRYQAVNLRQYNLAQNYPNPFNPVTSIQYQLPILSQVDLSIYNILGQKMATLVSETQHAGLYQVEWDAAGLASGIYLYRLKTDQGFEATRKLILMK